MVVGVGVAAVVVADVVVDDAAVVDTAFADTASPDAAFVEAAVVGAAGAGAAVAGAAELGPALRYLRVYAELVVCFDRKMLSAVQALTLTGRDPAAYSASDTSLGRHPAAAIQHYSCAAPG